MMALGTSVYDQTAAPHDGDSTAIAECREFLLMAPAEERRGLTPTTRLAYVLRMLDLAKIALKESESRR